MAHTTTRAFIDDELLEGSGLGRSGVETLADALEAQRGSFKLTLRRGGSRPGPGTYGYVGAEVVLDKCEYAAPKEVFDFWEDVKKACQRARSSVRSSSTGSVWETGASPNILTKSVEARRKVAVSTPSPVIGTSAKD